MRLVLLYPSQGNNTMRSQGSPPTPTCRATVLVSPREWSLSLSKSSQSLTDTSYSPWPCLLGFSPHEFPLLVICCLLKLSTSPSLKVLLTTLQPGFGGLCRHTCLILWHHKTLGHIHVPPRQENLFYYYYYYFATRD